MDEIIGLIRGDIRGGLKIIEDTELIGFRAPIVGSQAKLVASLEDRLLVSCNPNFYVACFAAISARDKVDPLIYDARTIRGVTNE